MITVQIQPPEQNFAKGFSLGILTVLLGSCVAAIGKQLTTLVDISAIVLFQYLICFLFTLPWLFRNRSTAFKTQYPLQHIIRGVSGCLCFYAYYVALKYIPLVDASLLRNTAPLVVPVVLLIGFGIAIPKARWLALVIGFIGIAVILRPGQQGLSLWHLVGFSSGAGLGISMVLTRVLAQNEPERQDPVFLFPDLAAVCSAFFYYQLSTHTAGGYTGLNGGWRRYVFYLCDLHPSLQLR